MSILTDHAKMSLQVNVITKGFVRVRGVADRERHLDSHILFVVIFKMYPF